MCNVAKRRIESTKVQTDLFDTRMSKTHDLVPT